MAEREKTVVDTARIEGRSLAQEVRHRSDVAKRKKTDIVQFKLRIREELRRQLEAVAHAEERSLNSEIASRLENSFTRERNLILLESLLAPGMGLSLVRAVGIILRSAGRDWDTPPKSHSVAEAIRKIVAVLSHELRPDKNSFPNRDEKGSADQLAWGAVLVERLFDERLPSATIKVGLASTALNE
jgi:hypothetical protein